MKGKMKANRKATFLEIDFSGNHASFTRQNHNVQAIHPVHVFAFEVTAGHLLFVNTSSE